MSKLNMFILCVCGLFCVSLILITINISLSIGNIENSQCKEKTNIKIFTNVKSIVIQMKNGITEEYNFTKLKTLKIYSLPDKFSPDGKEQNNVFLEQIRLKK